MGTDKVIFEEEQPELTGSNVSHVTGSDITGSHVTFHVLFSRTHPPPYFYFPHLFSRTFSPCFLSCTFFSYFFSRTFSRNCLPVIFPVLFSPYFFPYFFLSSSTTNVGWGCSLRRLRSITIGNHPLLFSYIRCSLRRPRPITIGNYPLLFSYIRCSLRRPRPMTIGNYPPFIFIY